MSATSRLEHEGREIFTVRVCAGVIQRHLSQWEVNHDVWARSEEMTHGCPDPVVIHGLISIQNDGNALAGVNIKRVHDERLVAVAVGLDDCQRVSFYGELERGHRGHVDHPEPIALARRDTNDGTCHCAASNEATRTIDKTRIRGRRGRGGVGRCVLEGGRNVSGDVVIPVIQRDNCRFIIDIVQAGLWVSGIIYGGSTVYSLVHRLVGLGTHR